MRLFGFSALSGFIEDFMFKDMENIQIQIYCSGKWANMRVQIIAHFTTLNLRIPSAKVEAE